MARAAVILLFLVTIACINAYPEEPKSDSDCGPNEVFNACGSACVDSCDKPASPICTLRCVIGCQCKDGFVRNKDNQCVLTRDC